MLAQDSHHIKSVEVAMGGGCSNGGGSPFSEGLTYFGQHFSQPAGSQGTLCEIRAGFLPDAWSLGEGQHAAWMEEILSRRRPCRRGSLGLGEARTVGLE